MNKFVDHPTSLKKAVGLYIKKRKQAETRNYLDYCIRKSALTTDFSGVPQSLRHRETTTSCKGRV